MTDAYEREEETGFVETALAAADSGNAGHWPTVARYLADEVRRLRAELEALKPVVVDREAIERVLRERMLNSNFTAVTHEPLRTQVIDQWVQVFADGVLAALYPKATEGKS